MKKHGLMATLFGVFLLCSVVATAQQVGLPRVPQRIYFEEPDPELTRAYPLLAALPEYLFHSISDIQAVVRVATMVQASSVIRTVASSASSDGPRIELVAGKDGIVESALIDEPGSIDGVLAGVRTAAPLFAPHLPFVEPELERRAGEGSSIQGIVKDVREADALARPYEITFSVSGLLRTPPNDANSAGSTVLPALPMSADATWYLSRSFGVVGSLWLYSGTDIELRNGYPRALLLLPGIGIRYRTLGRLFAQAELSLRGGYGHVENTGPDAIVDNGELFLEAGQSISMFYALVSLSASLGYNIDERLAILTRWSFNDDPTTGKDYFLQLFTLGLLYRF